MRPSSNCLGSVVSPVTTGTAGEPVLEARGLVKTFGRVQALRGASFSVYPGEVVALIGDNGAGKSALLKCLSGVYQPDAGEIRAMKLVCHTFA